MSNTAQINQAILDKYQPGKLMTLNQYMVFPNKATQKDIDRRPSVFVPSKGKNRASKEAYENIGYRHFSSDEVCLILSSKITEHYLEVDFLFEEKVWYFTTPVLYLKGSGRSKDPYDKNITVY